MATRQHNVEEMHFQLRSKAVLNSDETELFELSQLAGITMDPEIFKIIMDLLKLNVSPVALANTLHSMCSPHHNDASNRDSSQNKSSYSKRFDHSSSHTGASLSSTALHSVSEAARKSKIDSSSRSNPSTRDSTTTRDHGSSRVKSLHRDGAQGHTTKSKFTTSRSYGSLHSENSSLTDSSRRMSQRENKRHL